MSIINLAKIRDYIKEQIPDVIVERFYLKSSSDKDRFTVVVSHKCKEDPPHIHESHIDLDKVPELYFLDSESGVESVFTVEYELLRKEYYVK